MPSSPVRFFVPADYHSHLFVRVTFQKYPRVPDVIAAPGWRGDALLVARAGLGCALNSMTCSDVELSVLIGFVARGRVPAFGDIRHRGVLRREASERRGCL